MSDQFAVIFPGQGSQAVGMLSELATEYSLIKETFDHASEVLGYDTWHIAQHNPEDKLNQTQYTQPILLVASYAVWQLFKQTTTKLPIIMAGHSLGEYSALVCANALSFEDGLKLVATRGKLMQQAVPDGEGAMAAILGLGDGQIEKICTDITNENAVVTPANYNAPGQVVISGHCVAVERAIELLKERGARRAVMLPVSVPSHCELMRPAADELAKTLAETNINLPEIPVLHNVNALTASAAGEIRQLLTEQLFKSVRWVDCVHAMAENTDTLLECGPGKVLSGLCKRIKRDVDVISLDNKEGLITILQL